MANEPQQPENKEDGTPRRRPFAINLWLLLIGLVFVAMFVATQFGVQRDLIDYSFLLDQIQALNVERIDFVDKEVIGKFIDPPLDPKKAESKTQEKTPTEGSPNGPRLKKDFHAYLLDSESRENLRQLLGTNHVPFADRAPMQDTMQTFWLLLLILVPVGLTIFLWTQFRKTRDQMMGGGFLTGFGKSPAKRYEATRQPITFKDVAGLEGVKADLLEIVDFLKSPERFQKLGGRIPKGVLLVGPPGTGKTLLARAVAGEAGVPFFSVNGSEFIQMFVGVGASRVRDLFKTAKDAAPAIIFIDEIDAVGRQRGAGLGGGHDEREQTLNQILGEMDGFSQTEAVIVMAATNRPDVLDPALLRPGRFDRHTTVGRPTLKGRVEIFKVHVRDVPLAEDVDLERLAAGTIGLTGADIRNIVNEAALWAARQDKTQVDMSDFDYARDKILIGAKREEVLDDKEKEKTAYHEAGHALTAWMLPGAHRVHKVTIIPRGRSLGATQMVPAEERMNMSETEFRDHLVFLLGGRAAEKMIYHETTAGAENDLERATDLARHMVTHWGMSERLGPVSYKTTDEDPFLGREMHRQRAFSERTMELIDEEVSQLLRRADEQATTVLTAHIDKLETLTRALLKDEELAEREIAALIGPSIHVESNGRVVPK